MFALLENMKSIFLTIFFCLSLLFGSSSHTLSNVIQTSSAVNLPTIGGSVCFQTLYSWVRNEIGEREKEIHVLI